MSGSSKSSGHFWPAYVDMMTVLLMVFLLLTLLFQVVAGIARMQEGLKLKVAATLSNPVAASSSDDLVLRFTTPGDAMTTDDEAKVLAWLGHHAEACAKNGCAVWAISGSGDADVGKKLSVQYSRLLRIRQMAADAKYGVDNLEVINRIDEAKQGEDGTIRLSVKSP